MSTGIEMDQRGREETASRRCSARCADGSPCRAWAVRGSDPPRCSPHCGGQRPVGAQSGNQNALTHGFYASNGGGGLWDDGGGINEIIEDLQGKRRRISQYIDEHLDDLAAGELVSLLRVHAQSCSRLGRLFRDRERLTGGWSGEWERIMAQALDELHEELGTVVP